MDVPTQEALREAYRMLVECAQITANRTDAEISVKLRKTKGQWRLVDSEINRRDFLTVTNKASQ